MATQFKEDKWILLFEQCPEDFTTARCHGKEAFKPTQGAEIKHAPSIPHLERALGSTLHQCEECSIILQKAQG
jgi:hypothetical protein